MLFNHHFTSLFNASTFLRSSVALTPFADRNMTHSHKPRAGLRRRSLLQLTLESALVWAGAVTGVGGKLGAEFFK